MKPSLLILAAGMGNRYGGLKQLDRVGPSGETIMDYAIYDAKRAGFAKIVFVIRKSLASDFKEKVFSKYKNFIAIDYVFQELAILPKGYKLQKDRLKPWGTAHAVMVAAQKINGTFAVINADDFYGRNAYKIMYSFLTSTANASHNYALLTYSLQNTISKHGKVSRGICEIDTNKQLKKVVEHKKIYSKNATIYSLLDSGKIINLEKDRLTSMNFMGFTSSVFPYIEKYFKAFLDNSETTPNSEFFLPSLLTSLIKNNEANIVTLHTDEQWFGVTYKEDKALVISSIQNKIRAGEYPNKLFDLGR